jgi:tetratricopeptide (TPR) repeat protein
VKGCLQEAYKEWEEMPKQYPTEWLAYFSLADCMAKACRYDEAVLYFNKATEIHNQDIPMHLRQLHILRKFEVIIMQRLRQGKMKFNF